MPESGVSFALYWLPHPTQRFVLQLDLQGDAAPEALEQLRARIAAFVALGAKGAFVMPNVHPADGRLELSSEQVSARSASFEVEAENFDARGLRVLENLMLSYDGKIHGISRFEIKTLTPEPAVAQTLVQPVTEDNSFDVYPQQSTAASIKVDLDEPLDFHKSRRCLAEYGEPTPREQLEALKACIGAWADVVEFGGYSAPVKSAAEAEAWVSTLEIYDDYSVELAFSLFEAADESWNTLLNSLAHLSVQGAPIELVSIE